jgi:hypothetical protein
LRKSPIDLAEDVDGDLRFVLDHVDVGDDVPVLVDDETAAQPAGRFDQHHALAQPVGQFFERGVGQIAGAIEVVA